MGKPLVTDELWEVVEPLLPPVVISPLGGRPPVGNRQALTGILFILKTGLAWEDLPQELGCGCGRTCFRRLMTWHEAGVWNRLHQLLLAKLHAAVVVQRVLSGQMCGIYRSIWNRLRDKRGEMRWSRNRSACDEARSSLAIQNSRTLGLPRRAA